MFSYNGKSLKNNEVQCISIIVQLGEKFKEKEWRENERYVRKQLIKFGNTIPMPVECPIEDLVYLQPKFSGETDEGYYIKTKTDYELLTRAYDKVIETFKNKKVFVVVHSDYISDQYNEITLNIGEFKKCYKLD